MRALFPPPPPALVERLKLAPFYRQWCDADGLPILSSEKVSPYALAEARFLIDRMLERRPELRPAIAKAGIRVAVMGYAERTCDIPEHSDLTPKDYWNRRARGLGATRWRPAISGAEENLLSFPGDPYAGESILMHEFAHTIHELGLRTLESDFEARLKRCYDSALTKGLWKGTYAATNPAEYWAEGVQDWFDCNQKPNASHNEIRTREGLQRYDPDLATLIEKSLRAPQWRWSPIAERLAQPHLKGYDPRSTPTFRWG